MRAASIDIGTNTVLLLVGDVDDGTIKPIEEKQRIPRLGKGVDKDKNLHPDSMERVLVNLREYKRFLDQNFPDISSQVIVTATSAVRDASNRDEFLDLVKRDVGWVIQLLSGTEEAKTTYIGALSVLHGRAEKANLVMDIGGGSTELAFGHGFDLQHAISLDMGSVRFTERFFADNPPSNKQMDRVRSAIQNLLKDQNKPNKTFDLIGVAGTVTSVAAIEIGLQEYDVNRLNGFQLKRSAVEKFINEFSFTRWQEIEEKYPLFLKGRGEVILAGILIMGEVLKWAGKDSLLVSTGGIRHGVLLRKMDS